MEEEKKVLKISKSLLRKTIILGVLLIIGILLIILRNYKDFCEGYSKTIVRFYCFVFGNISSFFPFSFFEIFVISTVIYAVTWIVFFIRNTKRTGIKKTYHMIMRLMIIIGSVLVIYQGTAGMEYNRQKIDIPQHTKLISNPKDYKQIAMSFLDDFNECASKLEFNEEGSVVRPYGHDTIVQKLIYEFSKYDSDFFHGYTPKAKPMYLTGWFYRMMSITGVTFVPTGEANYNILDTDAFFPFTIAHEMAHMKGAMSEEDAQLTAAYICLNSDDPYIRFSGYDQTIWSLTSLVMATNVESDLNEFYANVDSRIYRNNAYVNQYWKDHGTFRKIADWLNDLYLKFNQDNGTVSYSDNIDVGQEKEEYVVYSYSRYQALYMWMYLDK